ncbi:hypothetical protein ACVIGB_000475 [Bradyrhizobium sp. USDA 4341]
MRRRAEHQPPVGPGAPQIHSLERGAMQRPGVDHAAGEARLHEITQRLLLEQLAVDAGRIRIGGAHRRGEDPPAVLEKRQSFGEQLNGTEMVCMPHDVGSAPPAVNDAPVVMVNRSGTQH